MKQESKKWPITVEDHQEQGRIHAEKQSAVNAALKFPTGSAFDEDLGEILASDAEANGEVVAIALVDCDKFDHINKDFSREAGDNVLISAGEYIRDNLPEGAKVYRIGGDEFGIIFRGTMEREEIFLFLNDLKNNYGVQTPDGVRQTITAGMATAFEDASRCTELIRKADGALFRAKVAGGNKVAMAKEEKMVPKTSHFTQDQLQRLAKLAKREGVGEAILLREALTVLYEAVSRSGGSEQVPADLRQTSVGVEAALQLRDVDPRGDGGLDELEVTAVAVCIVSEVGVAGLDEDDGTDAYLAEDGGEEDAGIDAVGLASVPHIVEETYVLHIG